MRFLASSENRMGRTEEDDPTSRRSKPNSREGKRSKGMSKYEIGDAEGQPDVFLAQLEALKHEYVHKHNSLKGKKAPAKPSTSQERKNNGGESW